jgi:hypothetical protein
VAFYTGTLGFELKHQRGEAFAAVSSGGLDLLLSGAESSGARPLPDGQQQEAGGWNRLVLASMIWRAPSPFCAIAASRFGTPSSADLVESRSRFWIPTAIRSNSSSPHDVLEPSPPQARRTLGNGGIVLADRQTNRPVLLLQAQRRATIRQLCTVVTVSHYREMAFKRGATGWKRPDC